MGDRIALAMGSTYLVPNMLWYMSRLWSLGQKILMCPANTAGLTAAWPLQADGMPSAIAASAKSTNSRMTPSRAAALGLPTIRTTSSLTALHFHHSSRGLYCWGIIFDLDPAYSSNNFGIVGPNMNYYTYAQGNINSDDEMPAYCMFNQCVIRARPGQRCKKSLVANINHNACVNSWVENHHVDEESAAWWQTMGSGGARVDNNTIAGGTIGLFFGGSHFSSSAYPWHVGLLPRDAWLRHNWIVTPDEWLSTHPSFNLAQHEPRKNPLEWKIGGRHYVRGNRIQGSAAIGQNGQGITIKVLNEAYDAGGTYGGPMYWSETHDIYLAYNLQVKTGNGFDILGNQQPFYRFGPGLGEGTQVNHVLMEHNIILVGDATEGYTGSGNNRMGYWQAYPASDAAFGRKAASWWLRHNTLLSRGGRTSYNGTHFNIHFELTGFWDSPWPKLENNILARATWKTFNQTGSGTPAVIFANRMPGITLNKNVIANPNAGENSFGSYAGNNYFLNNNTPLEIDPFTGALSVTSPARAGGAYQASDGTDNGADWDQVMAEVAGADVWDGD
jgi:hypothetical protein